MDPSLPGVIHSGGGHSSLVRDQLRGVQQIQATSGAFAAILEDGSVVAWGDAGLWRWTVWQLEIHLKGVQRIQATDRAFAAILADGSVVYLGRSRLGR